MLRTFQAVINSRKGMGVIFSFAEERHWQGREEAGGRPSSVEPIPGSLTSTSLGLGTPAKGVWGLQCTRRGNYVAAAMGHGDRNIEY